MMRGCVAILSVFNPFIDRAYFGGARRGKRVQTAASDDHDDDVVVTGIRAAPPQCLICERSDNIVVDGPSCEHHGHPACIRWYNTVNLQITDGLQLLSPVCRFRFPVDAIFGDEDGISEQHGHSSKDDDSDDQDYNPHSDYYCKFRDSRIHQYPI